MDGEAWRATVHGVTRVGHDLVTQPPKIPWMEEPDGLQSMGSLRVGHD